MLYWAVTLETCREISPYKKEIFYLVTQAFRFRVTSGWKFWNSLHRYILNANIIKHTKNTNTAKCKTRSLPGEQSTRAQTKGHLHCWWCVKWRFSERPSPRLMKFGGWSPVRSQECMPCVWAIRSLHLRTPRALVFSEVVCRPILGCIRWSLVFTSHAHFFYQSW